MALEIRQKDCDAMDSTSKTKLNFEKMNKHVNENLKMTAAI